VGLVSRRGIVPISHSQGTAGPLARSVRDAAFLLSAMCGPDPADAANAAVGNRFQSDYLRFLNPDGLRDARGCTSPAAIAGYLHISVPAGLHRGLPIGLSFFGAAFSEPTLLKLASGFEHIAAPRPVPRFVPHV
jgi:Asp-tRNA(Asn)/Glu-tRNA(Gln) amidotransferase A subunit family amidase